MKVDEKVLQWVGMKAVQTAGHLAALMAVKRVVWKVVLWVSILADPRDCSKAVKMAACLVLMMAVQSV